MTRGARLEVAFDRARGPPLRLPERLRRVYGPFCLPAPPRRPFVFANFAATLDGVVAFAGSRSGGGDVSGHKPEDRLLMGLLRAVSDAVVVGAGTLRSVPRHRWTPEHIFPSYAREYRELRRTLGLAPEPTNVIVTSRGDLDLTLPVFTTPGLPALVVTTPAGAGQLLRGTIPSTTHIEVAGDGPAVRPAQLLGAIARHTPSRRILVEGGPHLIGDFFADRALDELFLTLAPQVAGRGIGAEVLGLVEGHLFGPGNPRWGRLHSVRRSGDHLFLRFGFGGGGRTPRRPGRATRS
jgi:riboflavin biosynthesis pyrimidine reductase